MISTIETLIPHGAVCSSMILCRSAFRRSRSANSVSDKSELIVGGEGLSRREAEPGDFLTLRYADCVAALPLLSGAQNLVGRDGSWIIVRPFRYTNGEQAMATILSKLAPEKLVPFTDQERELTPIIERELGHALMGRVDTELEALPAMLERDEGLRHLAEGWRGTQLGLITLTDRRLMFLWGNLDDFVEVPVEGISQAVVKGLRRKRLIVTGEAETIELKAVRPSARLEELAGALAPAR